MYFKKFAMVSTVKIFVFLVSKLQNQSKSYGYTNFGLFCSVPQELSRKVYQPRELHEIYEKSVG